MIILGIDPGTATTGYGIIKISSRRKKLNKSGRKRQKPIAIDWGCIKTDSGLPPGDRLKKINKELNKLIKKHNPTILAVENLYFFKNLKTAIPVSQAKGVILLTAARKKIPVYELTPLQVKMKITGYGRAKKEEVQRKIQYLLDLKKSNKKITKARDDAIDALGVALCYAKIKKLTS